MVSSATIICICISMVICLLLPVAGLIFLAAKYKKQGIVSAWLLGAAGFFVTQILIRVPILTLLQTQPWFGKFAESHLFLYAFSLAFTAGLFELAGRYVVAKILSRKADYKRSLAAGLGHGGIEAMLLAGITMVNNLLYAVMINSGAFQDLIVQAGATGVDVSQLEMIATQLVSYPSALFLLGAFERILSMTAHAAMSMLVFYGITHNKKRACILLCLGIHVFIDLTAGLTLVLPQTTAYWIIYSILAAVAALSLWILKELRRRWPDDKEVSCHAA